MTATFKYYFIANIKQQTCLLISFESMFITKPTSLGHIPKDWITYKKE